MGVRTKYKVAFLGMMTAFAVILGYIEYLLPFSLGVPGIKLGLANFIVVLVLFLFSAKDAFVLNLLRILLSGFLFGSFSVILYSLAGGLVSFLVMMAVRRGKRFTIAGVSMLGGVFHNIGQLMMAVLVVKTTQLFYYLPVLLIAGMITGGVIGKLAEIIVKRLKKSRKGEEGL